MQMRDSNAEVDVKGRRRRIEGAAKIKAVGRIRDDTKRFSFRVQIRLGSRDSQRLEANVTKWTPCVGIHFSIDGHAF